MAAGFIKKYDVLINNDSDEVIIGSGNWIRLLRDIHILLEATEHYSQSDIIFDDGAYARQKRDQFMTGLIG